MKIKEINYGIGYCGIQNGEPIIELNKHLKKYPKLYKSVLDHELEHAKSNKHMDFWQDFKAMFGSMNFELAKFSIRHPSALLSVSPILFTKKGIGVNLFMLFVWGTIGLGIWGLT